MDFKLLQVKFQDWDACEVFSEITFNQPYCKLIRFGLFNLLSEGMVNLIQLRELLLVHHSDISPKLNQLTG